MKDLGVVSNITDISSWLIHNQDLFLSYIVNIISTIIVSIVGIILSIFISKTVSNMMISHKVDATIVDFLSILVRYAIILFTIIAALGRIGVQTASIITILGTVGLAIGLALQGSLSDLAAGILLVAFRPFRSGEYVDIGSVSGNVINVHIFSTSLRTLDGKILFVPNSKIITGNIINFSREPNRRNQWIIGVSYDVDIDQVKQLLTKIINSEDRILKEKNITIRLHELGDSSIHFLVRAWSKNSDLMDVYWDVLEKIKREFDANGISFPYPQMDINFKCQKKLE